MVFVSVAAVSTEKSSGLRVTCKLGSINMRILRTHRTYRCYCVEGNVAQMLLPFWLFTQTKVDVFQRILTVFNLKVIDLDINDDGTYQECVTYFGTTLIALNSCTVYVEHRRGVAYINKYV